MSIDRASIVVLALAVAGSVDTAAAQALPDATRGWETGPALFYLEVVVNGLPTGKVVPVDYREGSYYVASDGLRSLSIRTDAPAGEKVAVDRIAGVSVTYDSPGQRLLITVPADWLPSQSIGRNWIRRRVPAETSFGAVLNYDIHVSASRGAGQYVGWTEQRLFDHWGTVSNTGVYRGRFEDTAAAPRYLRYDTSWTYADENRIVTYQAGDVVTGSLPWTTAVRIGGVSIRRSFNVRPDLITYPLPQFAGRAAVPSAVDLLIEGRPAVTADVLPGPFVIDDVPLVTGAGTATIITTDAIGRRVSTDVSFYVANTLLRKGLADFSLSAGLMRRAFGVRSAAYGAPVGSGTFRYGLTDWLSIATHMEGGGRQITTGGGVDMRLGRWGVLGFSASDGRYAGTSGQRYSLAYSYNTRRFGVALQHLQRTEGFSDLTAHDVPATATGPRHAQRLVQATAAVQLGQRSGTLGAGYFDSVTATGEERRVATVSYYRPLLGRSSLHAAVHHRLGEAHSNDRTLQLQLIVPFGRAGSGAVRTAQRGSERPGGGFHYSRTVPISGGLGWNAGYADSSGGQADVTWRTPHAQVQGGMRNQRGDYGGWASVSGAAIVMDGGVFATSRVADAFVLVDTNGHEGVPVRFEHQVVGTTNRRGHLMVPWTTAYYAASYQIDPLMLDADVYAPITERRVAVRRNSGLVVAFPLERIVAALVSLVDGTGRPLPVGATVLHAQTGQATVVGWDGLAYLEGAQPSNQLRVSLPNGDVCTAAFSFATTPGHVQRVGPVPCR